MRARFWWKWKLANLKEYRHIAIGKWCLFMNFKCVCSETSSSGLNHRPTPWWNLTVRFLVFELHDRNIPNPTIQSWEGREALLCRLYSQRDRPDVPRARCAASDKVDDRRYADFPALVRARNVRLRRYADQRQERPCLRDTDEGHQHEEAHRHRAAAVSADHQGSGSRSDRFFPEIRDGQAVAHHRRAAAGNGTAAIPRGCGAADGIDKVHHVRLLHDKLPIALVERKLFRSSRDTKRLSLCIRHARRSSRRPHDSDGLARWRMALPHNLQLRRSLPEGDQHHMAYLAGEEAVSVAGTITWIIRLGGMMLIFPIDPSTSTGHAFGTNVGFSCCSG